MKFPQEEYDWIVGTLERIEFLTPDPNQMENYRSDMAMLADSMIKETIENGEPVIVEGQKAGSFYIIRSGRAGVWINREGERVKVASLGPGSCFGEISLLTGGPCTATVTAEAGSMDVYRLRPKIFQGVLKSNPRLQGKLSDLMQKRLSEQKAVVEILEKKRIEGDRPEEGNG